MALLDAQPTESPLGIAIASGELLACLLDALVAQSALNKYQAFSVVIAAQGRAAKLPAGSIYDDARLVLRNLVKRFPAQ
jgi:hypothetical protein